MLTIGKGGSIRLIPPSPQNDQKSRLLVAFLFSGKYCKRVCMDLKENKKHGAQRSAFLIHCMGKCGSSRSDNRPESTIHEKTPRFSGGVFLFYGQRWKLCFHKRTHKITTEWSEDFFMLTIGNTWIASANRSESINQKNLELPRTLTKVKLRCEKGLPGI